MFCLYLFDRGKICRMSFSEQTSGPIVISVSLSNFGRIFQPSILLFGMQSKQLITQALSFRASQGL